MKNSKDIRPVTYLKSKAADILLQINETHRPVIITQNGEPRVVLQDPESYERMKSAIGLMKLVAQGSTRLSRSARRISSAWLQSITLGFVQKGRIALSTLAKHSAAFLFTLP